MKGVEEVSADSKSSKVVVKGKAADPMKVLKRLQKKSGKKVELISPLPKPPQDKKEEEEIKEPPKPEEKKDEVTIKLLFHFFSYLYIYLNLQLRLDGYDLEFKV